MEQRIAEEFSLLQEAFPLAVRKDRWFWLPEFPLPLGWSSRLIPISFMVRDGYPAAGLYGIYVPTGLRFNGTMPANYNDNASGPPFDGQWGMFSWEAEGWMPKTDPRAGHNFLTWVRGFGVRFREGL
jgi:hypothetical protein